MNSIRDRTRLWETELAGNYCGSNSEKLVETQQLSKTILEGVLK